MKLRLMQSEKQYHIESHAKEKAAWEVERSSLLAQISKLKFKYASEFKQTLAAIDEIRDCVCELKTSQQDSLRGIVQAHDQKIKVSPT